MLTGLQATASVTPAPDEAPARASVIAKDRAFSDAYNSCSTVKLRSLFAIDAEIYLGGRGKHSGIGAFIDQIRSRECGRYERQTDESTMKVYALPPTLANPQAPDHADWQRWAAKQKGLRGRFDPEAFDEQKVKFANPALRLKRLLANLASRP